MKPAVAVRLGLTALRAAMDQSVFNEYSADVLRGAGVVVPGLGLFKQALGSKCGVTSVIFLLKFGDRSVNGTLSVRF